MLAAHVALSRTTPAPFLACLAALLAVAAPATGAASPSRGRPEPGFGITPGGFVWTVEPAARRLVLRDPGGGERAAFPMADEGHVLGVADSGARVTAPTPDGFRRRPARSGDELLVEARYVFRNADGSVRATVSTSALRGSTPGVLGEEVILLRSREGAWEVVRVAAEGETALGTIPEASVRRRVGRVSMPTVFAAPGGPAVLFSGARGDAAVRLDRPGSPFVPDPLDACGEGRAHLVLPHPDGLLLVSLRTAPAASPEDAGQPLAVAEVVDGEGRLARSVALGPFLEVFPLPDGGLLCLDGTEAVRFDDRFAEVSRAVLPLVEGTDPAAAARVVEQLRRLESLGTRAGGADWAELALLPGAPATRYLERARDDAPGALGRLARVADGDPEAPQAGRAAALLLESLRPGSRDELLRLLRERVEEGGPDWLRRAAAFALLSAAPGEAPAWALPAVAEAIAAGAGDESLSLPDEAFTEELAELVTAVDRARIETIVSERPEVAEGLLSGNLDEAFGGAFDELRFHAPPRRFARTLLDCTAGPPSAAGLLALSRVAEAAVESAPSAGEVGRGDADPWSSGGARGNLAAVLLEAQRSPDAGLRASAHAVGPLAGLPVDPARFRSDVLTRPDLGGLAFLGLVSDRTLTARAWEGLFLELFAGARAASRDPSACSFSSWPVLHAEGEGSLDRYCNLFAIVRFATLDLGDVEDPAFVSRERVGFLADFARSGSAPPELRLELRLGRAMRGQASEEDVLGILGERELAPAFRRIVLGKVPSGSDRVAAFLERELSWGRVPRPERPAWLEALARLDAPAADRVAAEAWARGTVPLDLGEGAAGAFARALDPVRVRGSETLRAELRRARGLPAVGLEAAAALARAGDPGSAAPLAAALLEGCPSCLTPADLAALFGPLGEEGLEALAHLAELTLPFVAAPLDALFELAPGRAAEIGLARLTSALAAGCVPEPLLPSLLANGLDPFPEVARALEDRGCDRARLRPGEPVAAGISRAASTEAGQAARRALDEVSSPGCRAALASLLGIDP